MQNKDIYHRHDITEQIFRLVDLFAIAVAFLLAMLLHKTYPSPLYILTLTSGMMAYLLSAEFGGVYNVEQGYAVKKHMSVVFFSWCTTIVILLMLGYMTKTTSELSRIVLGVWFIATPVLLYTWRYIIERLKLNRFKHGHNIKRIAILGATEVGAGIASYIDEHQGIGFEFVGFFDDRFDKNDRLGKNLSERVRGHCDDVVIQARNKQFEILYITLPMAAEKRIANFVEQLGDTTVSVHIVPNFFIYNLLHSRWHNIGDYYALSIYDSPFYGADSLIKKAEDMFFASVILLVIAVPMLFIAGAIKLTSPGPVIFYQKRYGISGKEVIIKKFRTMTVCDDGNEIKQAEKNDCRITKLGAFLRKTSLDELPQFFNVLDGSMSVVGPRPHAVAHNELYREEIDGYMLRHMVKPGITGWAQINGYRGATKKVELMEKRIEYDLYYIRNWSFPWDLKIIFLTVFKGFINKNAY